MPRSPRSSTWPRRPSSRIGPTCCGSWACATGSNWSATRSAAVWWRRRRALASGAPVRAPVDHIAAPPFPRDLAWVNSGPQQLESGRAMLVEFWDFCRPQSIRTLPYVKAWRERYPELRVIGVHAAGFPPSRDPDAVRAAVERLEIGYPVAI